MLPSSARRPSSGETAAVQRRRIRRDRATAHGRAGRDVPPARRAHRAFRRLPEPPRAREPPGSLERRRGHAREGARGRARALPRISAPLDHGATRGHAGTDRPPLPAIEPPRLAREAALRSLGKGTPRPRERGLANAPCGFRLSMLWMRWLPRAPARGTGRRERSPATGPLPGFGSSAYEPSLASEARSAETNASRVSGPSGAGRPLVSAARAPAPRRGRGALPSPGPRGAAPPRGR